MPSTAFLAPLAGHQVGPQGRRRRAPAVRPQPRRRARPDGRGEGAARHAPVARPPRAQHPLRPRPRLRPHLLRRRLPGPRAGSRLRVVLEHVLEGRLPALDDITWPGKIPYYALSSGTTSGATKYIPVSWEMVESNKKTAFTTIALFRHANPAAKLFTGKFFFLGGSTDLRKQADGSLAGDLSGIAAKELPRPPRRLRLPAAGA